MTRDFNKPKRDNSRPSFRDQPPNRNRDERSPRPARPRLNREMVDRAWESGAQQQHADYRPRTGGGQSRPQGPQQRNNGWRNAPNNQQSGYSSQNGHGNSRPYNNRQEGYRDTRSGGYRDTRDQRDTRGTPGNSNRSFNGENGSRPSFGQERRNDSGYRPRPSFGQERHDRGDQRPERSNSFNNSNRREGNDRQRFQDRGNQSRDFRRDDRPNTYGERPQRETSNPKWQSRPSQRNNTRGPEREFNRPANTGREQFEGDYEHFEEHDSHTPRDTRPARPAERPFRGSHNSQDRFQKSFGDNRSSQERPARRFDDRKSDVQPELHVTRLPDGRVLKGPRPVQRRNAQFWTGVSKDVSELVDQVDDKKPDDQIQAVRTDEVSATPIVQEEMVTTDEPHGEVISQEETPSTDGTPETPQKRRTRIASAVTRGKKSTQSKPSTMKPSQRGFKWPTQD